MEARKKGLLFLALGLAILTLVSIIWSIIPNQGRLFDPAIAFLGLSSGCLFFMYAAPARWHWLPWTYIPTAGFLAFGLVFLFNALTGDWKAWAYAWMLIIAGFALGVVITARELKLNIRIADIGIWTAAGFTLLAGGFGAIAGGPFIRVVALLILVGLGGGVVFKLRHRTPETDGPLSVPTETASLEGGKENAALVEPLSKRELEVLHYIDQGLSNADIAGKMIVAGSTVKTHINNIYTKLGVESRTQALRRARELGLLE